MLLPNRDRKKAIEKLIALMRETILRGKFVLACGNTKDKRKQASDICPLAQ
jgi:hypothetical protein